MSLALQEDSLPLNHTGNCTKGYKQPYQSVPTQLRGDSPESGSENFLLVHGAHLDPGSRILMSPCLSDVVFEH